MPEAVRKLIVATGAPIVLFAACSLVVGGEPSYQCSSDADCLALGGPFKASVCTSNVCTPDPRWACFTAAPPTGAVPDPITITQPFIDGVTGKPTVGATVVVCAIRDPTCAQPLTPPAVTDDVGAVFLRIPTGGAPFTGSFQVQSPAIAPELENVATVYADETLPAVPTFTPSTLGLLETALGATPNPAEALVLIVAVDCTGQFAAGVHLSIDRTSPDTTPFYIKGGLPSTGPATDSLGLGGFVNVPAGNVTVSATNSAGYTFKQQPLITRAGYVHFVPL